MTGEEIDKIYECIKDFIVPREMTYEEQIAELDKALNAPFFHAAAPLARKPRLVASNDNPQRPLLMKATLFVSYNDANAPGQEFTGYARNRKVGSYGSLKEAIDGVRFFRGY